MCPRNSIRVASRIVSKAFPKFERFPQVIVEICKHLVGNNIFEDIVRNPATDFLINFIPHC